MYRAIRGIFFWHSRQIKEDNAKCPHLKFYQNIWSLNTFEQSLLDHCLKVPRNDVTPTIPQSDVTKISSQTKNDQPVPYLDILIWVSLFWYFAPRINMSAKWCHISFPAALEGGPELYEEDGGPRWVLFCQNASERAQAQREASTTSRLWALTHPHGPHPAHHHQSYPSQAPLGAQRPDTSGNNI